LACAATLKVEARGIAVKQLGILNRFIFPFNQVGR